MLKIYPEDLEFQGYSLIAGFHGIGAAGYWTVKYLIEKLNAERIAFVDSDIVSPVANASQGRLVTPYELFRKDNLVFFKVEVPPYKGSEVQFYREFAEWVISSGFRESALIGGLDSSLRRDESTHRVVYTRAYQPKGEIIKSSILEDNHIIVGPVATLLNQFEIRNFPAYAILAYASTERVDPRAAATAVTILSRQYGFEVDVGPLIRGAEALESEVAKQEAKVRKGGEYIYT